MRILESIFYYPMSFCSLIESGWRDAGAPLLGRVYIPNLGLLAWVQERCGWIRNIFLNFLWPEASFQGPVSGRLKEAEKAQPKGCCPPVDLLGELCDDPYGFYERIQAAKSTSSQAEKHSFFRNYDQALRFFTLCSCKKMTPSLRIDLENAVVAKMQEIHPDKIAPITVVSVGAGGLYQEIVYLAKLVNAGYEKVIFIAIDSDPTRPLMGALLIFCKEALKDKVDAEQSIYPSLESYQEEAKEHPHLKPDLLLCIDLSDERFNVKGKPLPDCAFSLLQQNGILKEKTIIAHSFLEEFSERRSVRFICKAACVQNTLGEESLHALQQRKREFQLEFDSS
ncbi:MAG: hypothetical protein IT584_01040 [Chlamydiae bacterium]|nr:hypothetical protein [Chlamydiota bacterium]